MSKLRVLSAAGLIAVALFEGYRAMPYLDSVGIPTDGFGNTYEVVLGKKVTVEQALQQLEKNTRTAQDAVNRCVNTYISQQTFDAFVSFTYNVGGNAFCKSTLVKKFNAGEKHQACEELTRWVYAGGKIRNGLRIRREKERDMCLEGLQ